MSIAQLFCSVLIVKVHSKCSVFSSRIVILKGSVRSVEILVKYFVLSIRVGSFVILKK